MSFNVVLTLVFLISSALIAGFTSAILQIGRIRAKEIFSKIPTLFFFQHLIKPLFGRFRWEGLFMTLSLSKHALHLGYGVMALFILLVQDPFFNALKQNKFDLDPFWILVTGGIVISLSLISDLIAKLIASTAPEMAIKTISFIASIFLTLFSPLSALFLHFFNALSSRERGKKESVRDKLLEVLYESDFSPYLDPQERKLILSVASFKERIAREVMVPRTDVFCIPESTTVKEAAQTFLKEGYSRIPIYEDNIDHISGVLLYKDILSAFAHNKPALSDTIKSLVKPVLYAPETKKISHLLQEFKNRQTHLAIVVDEYGVTQGIVTIEDILEELVGDIADEYDSNAEVLFSVLPSGGWIVDGRMTLLDIEKELGLQIPHSPEYDTLGGYIFFRAGSIPTKGWKLHHDDFDLEILSSDDRSVEKVRITSHISRP